jgi:hypothetical protein
MNAAMNPPDTLALAGTADNDDSTLDPALGAQLEVSWAPVHAGERPVTVVVVRDGRGRLIEQIEGDDGLDALGRAMSRCVSRGMHVTTITESRGRVERERVAERQRALAAEASRAWGVERAEPVEGE